MREYNTQLGGDAVAQQDVISSKRTARWTLRVAALLLTVITCLVLATTALHQVSHFTSACCTHAWTYSLVYVG